jgi:HSP20 family protein
MTVRSIVPWHWGRRSVPVRRVDRLFDGFFDEFRGFGLRPVGAFGETFRPTIDVSETDKEVKVAVELPGLDENDVEVSLAHNVLTISGEKKTEKEDEGKNYHRIERSYGSFKRCVSLPGEVESDKVEAAFKNGVLTVTLPKTAEAQARKIEVKTS